MGVSTSQCFQILACHSRISRVRCPKYLRLVSMGVEHGIVCIDYFGILIYTMGDVLWLCEYKHDYVGMVIY